MANGAPMLVNYQGRLTPVEKLPDEELLRIAQAAGGVIPGAQPPTQPAPLSVQETQQALAGIRPGATIPPSAPLTPEETRQALAGINPGARPPAVQSPLGREETQRILAGGAPAGRSPIIVNYQGKPTALEDLPEEVLTAPGFAEALRASGQLVPTPPTPVPKTPQPPTLADGNGGSSGPAAQLQRLILGATPTATPDFSIIGSRVPRAPGAVGSPDIAGLGRAPRDVERLQGLEAAAWTAQQPQQFGIGLPSPPPTFWGPQQTEEDKRRGIFTEWSAKDGQWVAVRRTGPEGEPYPLPKPVPMERPTFVSAAKGEAASLPEAPWETTGKAAAPAAPGTPAQPPGRPAGVTPDTERLLQAGFEAQRRAIDEAATVGARVEAARAASTEVQTQEARRAQAEQAALAAAQRQAGEKAEQDYRLAIEELKTPSGAINPARWWQQADTGTKIAAGIAAFLSGIAGSRNPVDSIIERDIAAQKDALDRLSESRRGQVQAKLSLLGAMRARFGDEQAALAATRAAAYGAAEAEARQMEAKATQGAAKARASELAGQLQTKQADAVSELRMRQAQTAGLQAEAAMSRAKVAALGQAGGLTPEEQKRVVATPYGTTLALNLEEAKKLNNATRAFYNLSQAADRLVQLREEYGQETLPGPIKNAMQADRNAVLLHYKNMMELGAAFTESEQQMVEAVTGGDPTRIAPGVLEGLKRFRDSVGREYSNMYRVATGREPFTGGVQPGGQ